MTPNKWWHYILLALVVGGLSLTALVAIAAALIYPTLPSLEALTDYRPKLPLRVYSEDGFLISEFGEERRAYVKIENVPQNMKDAVIAIEDRRFYQHGGIDTKGVLRAVVNNLSGGAKEGASTITMQVARNFFLTSERNLKRKINEALLALKIEHSLSKDKILELYINQIYLGQRAYGFAAASQVYYGKPLDKLNLAETALLAGLPKAPSGYNPFVNPKRAIQRQKEVLHDMYRFGFIKEATYKQALKQPLRFKASKQSRDLDADYVAEIVRNSLYEKYGDDIYSSGLKVYTTIRKSNQEAANTAIREGIIDYDLRHGYRGPEKQFGSDVLASNDSIDKALEEIEVFNGLIPAIVTEATPKKVTVRSKRGIDIEITGKDLALVDKTLKHKDTAKRTVKPGALVRIFKRSEDHWQIVQLPQIEAALVALDPQNGAVRALVGGFDFNRNKFNHATQAWRQPGSSFKPFVYSAALEKGFTPASMIEDAPLNFSATETGNKAWSPQNFDNEFEGPIRIRQALIKSKNMVSIRLLQAIGVNYAQDYITRFGFSPKNHPAYLTMALGAGSTTVWQMADAYAVFANGGYRVKPNLIAKVIDQHGKILMEAKLSEAGKGAPRVIDARNAYIMTSMMQSVVRHGTAMRALRLGRADIAGKTGTTNDHYDAWFTGYSPKQVAVAWVGYDKPQSLGRTETGGAAALPIWIRYMATALRSFPDVEPVTPEGISAIKIDPVTGTRVDDDDSEGVYEYFYHENPPPDAPSFFENLFGSDNEGDDAEMDESPPPASDSTFSPLLPNRAPPQPLPPKPNKEPQVNPLKPTNPI
jgi:penicillin-binding protein 1A